MRDREPGGIRDANTYPDYSSGTEDSGVPGGGENTHSWRYQEIVAAFGAIEVTDAVAQADRFEQIARWWDDGLRAFRHAVDESLASAWSGVGAVAAGRAVEDYVARAHQLTVALEQLPGVVRGAAEAIVATKYAVGSPGVEETGAAAWSADGAVHAMGSASAHGAASAAEEAARAAMRQRYVLPFAELVARIPVLPTPLRSLDSGEPNDRQLLIDSAGQSRGDRRAGLAVEVSADGEQNSSTSEEGTAEAEPIGDSEIDGRLRRGTEEPIDSPDSIDSGSVELDDRPTSSDCATTVASASAGVTGAAPASGTSAWTTPGGVGSLTAPTGTSAAPIDTTVVAAGRGPAAGSTAGRRGPRIYTSGTGDPTWSGLPPARTFRSARRTEAGYWPERSRIDGPGHRRRSVFRTRHNQVGRSLLPFRRSTADGACAGRGRRAWPAGVLDHAREHRGTTR
ncbi:hypothetical protein ATK86_1534 [Nocardia fluminea]|uniref:PPE family protein n=1 Tax=Nocardia fluminea TaxID=134984 RepID=A0A2N3V6D7_9NOCA|nr:hypothetical protein ATK86_1534 [Nocardia fluminea]